MLPIKAAQQAKVPKLPARPNQGISTKPVIRVPAIPIAVFNARTNPTSLPTLSFNTVRRAAAGKAAPKRRVAGKMMKAAARLKRAAIMAIRLLVASRTELPRLFWASGNHGPRKRKLNIASRPAPMISTPKSVHRDLTRSALFAISALPMTNPVR